MKAGLGWENRRDARADLFYYSPKINVYAIGGHNNTSEKLLSLDQVIQLQGGQSKVMSRDGNFSFQKFSNILDKISFMPHHIDKQSNIGAAGIDFVLSPKYQLNSYLIYSHEERKARQSTLNKYWLENEMQSQENQENQQGKKIGWGTANTDFIYEVKGKTYLDINFSSNLMLSRSSEEIQSLAVDTHQIQAHQRHRPDNIQLDVEWNRKFNPRNIGTLHLNSFWNDSKNSASWTDEQRPFALAFLDWQNQEYYTAQQQQKQSSFDLTANYKYYFIINKKNHLSCRIGQASSFNYRDIEMAQLLANGEINTWQKKQDTKARIYLHNSFLEGMYRHKRGRATLEIGTSLHRMEQGVKREHNNKMASFFWMPFATFETNIPRIGKINIRYKRNYNTAPVGYIYPAYQITSFNTLKKGYFPGSFKASHDLSLELHKTNIFKHSNWFVSSYLSLFDTEIQPSVTIQDNMDRLHSFYTSQQLSYRWITRITYSKEVGLWRFRPRLILTNNSGERKLNGQVLKAQSHNLNTGLDLSYRKKGIIFSLAYHHRLHWYIQSQTQNRSSNNTVQVHFSKRLRKSWFFKGTYTMERYQSSNSSFLSHQLNSSIEYKKKNQPWGFQILAYNLLNNKSVVHRTIDEFIVSEVQNYVRPFYILLSISYEL